MTLPDTTLTTLQPPDLAPATPAGAAPPPPEGGSGSGLTALVSAGIAVLGAVFAAHPNSTLARALHGALPQLATAIPAAITAVAAVVAAFARPPRGGK